MIIFFCIYTRLLVKTPSSSLMANLFTKLYN
jgi:hypothetical protein